MLNPARRRHLPLLVLMLALLPLMVPARAQAATAFGIAGTASPTVFSFDTAAPGTTTTQLPVTGLGVGETVEGFTLRPADLQFYVITRGAGGVGRLYTLDPLTGAASFITTLAADPADVSSPYSALSLTATSFGVDFNPVPDRIRVTSNEGANMRVNPLTGLVTTDADLNPGSPSITSVAYTNSFAGSGSTTLYDIDATSDTLNMQNPPNNGTLATVGSLGIDAGSTAFDISPSDNTAFLAATVGGSAGLYTVDLTTAVATLTGTIGDGTVDVRKIAVRPNLVSVDPASRLLGVPEGDGVAVVYINRADALANTASNINWTLSYGSATAGDLRTNVLAGSANFEIGQTRTFVLVPLKSDAVHETNESFSLSFTPGAATANGTPLVLNGTAVVTILDDDPADITKPALLAGPATSMPRATFLKRGLLVPWSSSEAGTGTATLRLGTTRIATAKLSISKAGVASVRLVATAAGKRKLRASSKRSLTVKVLLDLRDAAGNHGTTTRSVVLQR